MKKQILLCYFLVFIVMSQLFAQAGALDPSFDTDGILTNSLSSEDDYITAIRTQSDGKILVAGYNFDTSNITCIIVRYQPNGSLDTTFNHDGMVKDFDTIVPRSLAIQADGKILATGSKYNGIDSDFALKRYNANGSLDSTFGTNGLVITTLADMQYPSSVNLQTDGKIVLVGNCMGTNQYTFCAMRFNANGMIDSTFDIDGIALADTEVVAFTSYSTIQTDNKVISGIGAVGMSTLVRFNSDGSLDNSFHGVGVVRNDNAPANSIALQGNGKIITCGGVHGDTEQYFQLTCYNPDGTLDNNFGINGVVKLNDYDYIGLPKAVITQPDGKIIAGGIYYGKFAMVRFLSNGDFDVSFGDSGRVYTEVGTGPINALHLDGNGRILAGGSCGGNDLNWVIARYFSGLNLGALDFTHNSLNTFIYPNPFTENIRLKYELQETEDITIELWDIEGKFMETLQTQERKIAGPHTEDVYISPHLPDGNYMIVIMSKKGKIGLKIIKN